MIFSILEKLFYALSFCAGAMLAMGIGKRGEWWQFLIVILIGLLFGALGYLCGKFADGKRLSFPEFPKNKINLVNNLHWLSTTLLSIAILAQVISFIFFWPFLCDYSRDAKDVWIVFGLIATIVVVAWACLFLLQARTNKTVGLSFLIFGLITIVCPISGLICCGLGVFILRPLLNVSENPMLEPVDLLDPSESKLIDAKYLLDFAKEHGKMQVGNFINNSTKEEFKSCIFTNSDGEKKYVNFSPRLGVLSPKEISSSKEHLAVYIYDDGKMLLDIADDSLINSLPF